MSIRASRFLFTFLLSIISSVVCATPRISLVTLGPTDEEVFFLYGHTAIRVEDPERNEDLVYNYGYFSLEQENFIVNFLMGRPMYSLGVIPFDLFVEEYHNQGRAVLVQELNLTVKEADAFRHYLEWNALPENRNYLYNFYFDNCATRPRDLIEKFSGGLLFQEDALPKQTFREAIRLKSASSEWYTFGADLCLGWKSDQQMTLKDAAFLPDYLAKEINHAYRKDTGIPIVLKQRLLSHQSHVVPVAKRVTAPLVCFFFLIVIYLLLYYFKRVQIGRLFLNIFRGTLYLLLGLSGMIIWFLSLVSEHPHTWPNANLLLLHPFWLLLAATFVCRKYCKIAIWLYFANFVALIIYIVLGSTLQSLPIGALYLVCLLIIDLACAIRSERR